jgi:hybrid cluster-associated redox disulfide protein
MSTAITGEMMISDLVEKYPQVVDYLIIEYNFHCVSCFISSFETLGEGANVHGIKGADFEEMLDNVNKIASGELTYSNF